MQLQKISFIGIIGLLFLLLSCGNKVSDEFLINETWYFYDQTKCADVWDQYLTSENTYEEAIEHHFTNNTDITIQEIHIVDDGGVEQTCEACTCTTGTRIRVQADAEHQAALEGEGFTLE